MLEQLAAAGADEFEIFGARGHFDFYDRRHIREIADWFAQNGRHLHSMHSPMYFGMDFERSGQPTVNIIHPERRYRVEAMDEIKRAIEVAEQLPYKFLVQHIGDSHESFSTRKFDDAMTSIEHLSAFAKPLGITVLIENIPNELATPEKLVELITSAHFADVGVCFDLGHAHMLGGVEPAFRTLVPLIRSTHVHDNDGNTDAHLWPADGTIDWPQARELLESAPHHPPFLLEVKAFEFNVPQRYADARASFLDHDPAHLSS